MHYELITAVSDAMQNHEWILADYEKYRDREPMDDDRWWHLEKEANIERLFIHKLADFMQAIREYDKRTELEIEAQRRMA